MNQLWQAENVVVEVEVDLQVPGVPDRTSKADDILQCRWLNHVESLARLVSFE